MDHRGGSGCLRRIATAHVFRNCTHEQFEKVEKFHELKASGGLHSSGHVASTLIRLLMEGKFANGGCYDLRDLE